jgi:hypothetical protein
VPKESWLKVREVTTEVKVGGTSKLQGLYLDNLDLYFVQIQQVTLIIPPTTLDLHWGGIASFHFFHNFSTFAFIAWFVSIEGKTLGKTFERRGHVVYLTTRSLLGIVYIL